MRTRRLRFVLTALAVLTVACTPGGAASGNPEPDRKHPAATPTPSASRTGGDGLAAAVAKLAVAREHRDGYEREKFKLWTDADADGCDTRKEVLLAEAVTKPRKGEDCRLTGGTWRSYYDGETVTSDRRLDIDHMVPLAEAWDSGASAWSQGKRERYANDLDAERSLVAVTLGTNRSKGDQDPAEWMPPAKAALCTYATDWVSTKLRWKLSVDQAEQTKLKQLARACPDTSVEAEEAR